MAHCGQNILHFLTVFELNHVTRFGEWNVSRYNVCPSQQETLSVLCGLAYPLGFLTCNMRSACPRSPLLLQPGSENERQLEQTWLWTVRCHSWHTDLYVREKEMLFVVSHWDLGACLLYSIIAATWLTNTRFNLFLFSVWITNYWNIHPYHVDLQYQLCHKLNFCMHVGLLLESLFSSNSLFEYLLYHS